MTQKISAHVASALLVSASIALAAIGCSSPEPNIGSVGAGTAEPTADTTSDPGPGGANEKACEVDADCAVVETQCCDHCNGGKAEAYAKAFADAHKAKGCEQTMCTERACGDAVPACKDKVCAVVIKPLDGAPVGS